MAARPAPGTRPASAALYDRTAARASRAVLAGYSTSFGLGTRLLGPRARRDIEAVYALVRIADEVVDTHTGDDAAALLDELEAQTARALASGYSTNLVVHAFARTARRVGIGAAELDPFFASMRADLTVRVHDRESYERYVYGSAEVVGLMCLRVFLDADGADGAAGGPARRTDDATAAGARALGAAFQKINFLRDLGADSGELGRCYFPGVGPQGPTADQLTAILAEIRGDLARARAALPRLPRRPRAAVAATLALYDRLLAELAATPPEQVTARRVRVSAPRKVAALLPVLAGGMTRDAVGRVRRLPARRGRDLRIGQATSGQATSGQATAGQATAGRATDDGGAA